MTLGEGNTSRLMTCLLPSGSLLWLLSIMGTLENSGIGLTFSSLDAHTITYLNFSALHVLLMIIGSYVLYFIAIWYLDNVWPFQPGVPKSPIYLFYPSYWWPGKGGYDGESSRSAPNLDAQIFEGEPSDLNASIRIENVCKVFSGAIGGKKVAVNELWLNIYQNQITVLLGHNGAGKTTTMNMITGMYVSIV